MNATDIPFVSHIGIEGSEDGLSLALEENVLNHIGTIHAGAQFTLAETQSGMCLQSHFPELEGKVIALLRDAQIDYKKPAVDRLFASSTVDEGSIERFKARFDKRGRGSLQIKIEIRDINDVLTCQAVFTWFIQAL